MNLSERLDAARRARTSDTDAVADSSEPPDADATEQAELLRMTIDDRTYDGTDLRTGQHITSDEWKERGVDPERRLPSWNPDRANSDLEGPEWRLDDRVSAPDHADDAGVIHLTTTDAPTDDGLELPPWAAGASVYEPGQGIDRPEAGKSATCPSCGGPPELQHLDLLADKADLECRSCGLRWSESAAAYAPKAR